MTIFKFGQTFAMFYANSNFPVKPFWSRVVKSIVSFHMVDIILDMLTSQWNIPKPCRNVELVMNPFWDSNNLLKAASLDCVVHNKQSFFTDSVRFQYKILLLEKKISLTVLLNHLQECDD